jgi:hypothetical protein
MHMHGFTGIAFVGEKEEAIPLELKNVRHSRILAHSLFDSGLRAVIIKPDVRLPSSDCACRTDRVKAL